MSHVPDEFLSKLNVFNSLENHSFSLVCHKKPAPARRSTVHSTRRARQLKHDQDLAQKTRRQQEVQRPKLVVGEGRLSTARPADYYINRARQRYLSRTDLSNCSSTADSAVFRRPKSIEPQPQPPAIVSEAQPPPVYPAWLVARPDFVASLHKGQPPLSELVKVPPAQRSKEEAAGIRQWLASLKAFEFVPKPVLEEMGEALVLQTFAKGEALLTQDCVHLIVTGSVGIYTDGRRISLMGPKRVACQGHCKAEVSTVTAALPRALYLRAADCAKQRSRDDTTAFLGSIRFFRHWTHAKVQRLVDSLQLQSFKQDQVIYEVGADSDQFYILKTGTVRIQTYAEVAQQNQWPEAHKQWAVRQIYRRYLVNLASVPHGRCFGETDLIEERPRQTRAVAATDCTVLTLAKQDFFQLFTEKDTEQLQDISLLRIPSLHAMQSKILGEISERHAQEAVLLDAMKVDFANVAGREAMLDPRSKRLNRWVTSLSHRRRRSLDLSRQQVVSQKEVVLRVSSNLKKASG